VEFCHEPFLHPDLWLSMQIKPLSIEQAAATAKMGLEEWRQQWTQEKLDLMEQEGKDWPSPCCFIFYQCVVLL
jgi:hypothetical protein